jgi:hypothetical protein
MTSSNLIDRRTAARTHERERIFRNLASAQASLDRAALFLAQVRGRGEALDAGRLQAAAVRGWEEAGR